jgi:8-oxo-dGTP pyrophosphatase MutT (NUDIX family)
VADRKKRRIRPTAIVCVTRGDDLLVSLGDDPVKGETYFRPLGGGIDFGETAEEAVRREMREELAVDLGATRLLGVLENVYFLLGRPHHEIVFVFEADITDPGVYERDDVGVVLDEGSPVSWEPLDRFVTGEALLYPEGLLAMLTRSREPAPPAG